MKKSYLPAFFVLTTLLLVIDQVVKAMARKAGLGIEGHYIGPIIPNIIELKLVFNHGIAFGLFQGGGEFFFVPLALVMAIVSGVYVAKHPEEGIFSALTASFLASGALGNLIDRIVFQKVTDMFWFSFSSFPVFNFADSCITAAGVLLVWSAVRDLFKRSQPAADASPDPSAE